MNILFVPLYRIELPSSRYRLFQLLQPLQQAGISCTVLEAPNRSLWRRLWYLPKLLWFSTRSDLIFLQKRVLPLWLVKYLRLPFIFDIDDAIYLRPESTSGVNQTLQLANLVFAGNEELATYAQQFNQHVVMLPTVVDTAVYQPRTQHSTPGDERVVIGWIGTNPNRGDFAVIQPALAWLGRRYGDRVVLRIVSDQPLAMELPLETEFIPWSLDTSLSALQTFDIGLMPLEDSAWNRGKCGLKLIEYMAVGAASVASPVGVNAQIIEHGQSGYLATTIEEWQHYLDKLVNDQQLRKTIGMAATARVQEHYSVAAVLPTILSNVELLHAQVKTK